MVQIGDRVISHREPNPDEARIQAMSVIAACAKGLMYFQSEVSLTLAISGNSEASSDTLFFNHHKN